MILGWMVYSVLLAACVAAAAQALELMARRLGRPTRWVWTVAIVASVGVSQLARVTEVGILAFILPPAAAAPWLRAPAATFLHAYNPLDRWNPILTVVLWASSALVAVFFAWSLVRLLRRRRAWRAAVVDGHAVLVSESDGPAVFGIGRGVIVLPRWALGAADRVRELMLVHELEHLRAGDPRLLLLALVAVVVQPWNPVVWWLAGRLRLAVEVDCDARVLEHCSDVRTYGLVLLEAGTRAGAECRLPVPALSMPPSSLEQRLRVMCERGAGRARAGMLVLIVVLAVSTAAFLPEPGGLHCALEALGFPTATAGW
jgi:beta-lactamase regulating signal transducer with metallopeptidase domain